MIMLASGEGKDTVTLHLCAFNPLSKCSLSHYFICLSGISPRESAEPEEIDKAAENPTHGDFWLPLAVQAEWLGDYIMLVSKSKQ